MCEQDVLALPLYDQINNGIIEAHTKITDSIIENLICNRINGCYVYTNSSILDESIHENINHKGYVANLVLNDLKTRHCVKELINDIKNYDMDTYCHSLHVAFLCIVTALYCDYTNRQIYEIGTAALLHDVGKKCIPAEIIQKPSKLTDEEYEIVQGHSLYGYKLLKNIKSLDVDVKLAVKLHHENEDGSGYPYGISGEEITDYAKIIHICDVFDAIMSARSYKKVVNPIEGMNFIHKNRGTMFDKHFADIFIDNVAEALLRTKLVKIEEKKTTNRNFVKTKEAIL